MEQVARYHYNLQFRCDFLEKRGNAFQDFFSKLMQKIYPGDFITTRPWGKAGDRKNDGYEDLRIVLESIAKQAPPINDPVKPVDAGKLTTNALSADVEGLLTAGSIIRLPQCLCASVAKAIRFRQRPREASEALCSLLQPSEG
jgi:hypothetical protein